MTSIWEATCKCGKKTKVELHRHSDKRVLRVGCDDHWVELPADELRTALAEVEPDRKGKS